MSNLKRSAIFRQFIFDGVTLCFLSVVILALVVPPSHQQLMELTTNSMVVLGLFIFGLFLSYFLNQQGIATAGAWIFAMSKGRGLLTEVKPWWKRWAGWQLGLFLIASFGVGLIKTKFSLLELLNEDGFAGAVRLFKGIFSPNFAILPKAILNMIETIFMAYMETVLAAPLAFLLSFFCARNLMRGSSAFGFYLVMRTFLNFTRSVEALIWAIIFSVWVGIGPFAGMLALWVHAVASLMKQYSETIENVSEGPIEGIQSTGANRLQTIWFAVVPQVLLQEIAFTVYCWDVNVRMATVIGLVGGGGIGTMLIQYQGQAMWPEVGCLILVIAVVVWLLDQASAALRESLK